MDMLMDAFNPETCPAMMCRHQMNVGWDGTIYDCDFNPCHRLGAPLQSSPRESSPDLTWTGRCSRAKAVD